MPQSDFNIQHTAKLARLHLTDEEAQAFQSQLGRILDYMKALEAHDLGEVSPTAHAMPVYDVWREDEPVDGLTQQQALQNAPRKSAGQFQINRSVEDA